MKNRYDEYGREVVAEWQSARGAHRVVVTVDGPLEYGGYASTSGGGSTGTTGPLAAFNAVKVMVDRNYFLPDAAKTPMKLVYLSQRVTKAQVIGAEI